MSSKTGEWGWGRRAEERVDQKRYWTRMLCSSIPRKKFLKPLHTHGSTRIRLRGHQAPEHLWLSVWPQPRLPKRAKSWLRRVPEAAVSKDRQRLSPARGPAHRGVTSRGGGGRAEAARTHPSSVSRVGHTNLASVSRRVGDRRLGQERRSRCRCRRRWAWETHLTAPYRASRPTFSESSPALLGSDWLRPALRSLSGLGPPLPHV